MKSQDDLLFDLRWKRSAGDFFSAFRNLYGERPEVEARVKALLERHWQARPAELKALDLQRDLEPEWFLSEKMVGYVFYVDRFAGDFKGVLQHIPYLKSLGVSYVHFMPCLKPRPGNSDGGYSVMDYRAINPTLGTMADFEKVATALRHEGMTVTVDLVLNHTAKEHEWAMRAKKGEKKYQDYYLMFANQEEPLAYEKTLVEIFPNDAPGNFTFYPEIRKWVWTTFNEHQWDLNWANPEVFIEILDIMLFLANKGVDCLRLDAVAFMWKRLGTNCQNLPEVHDILQALRAATRVAAPALIHKAEAIVAPRDLVPYLGVGRHKGREANLAYHNNVMVQFWSSLAARDTRLMTHVLSTHFPESFRNASWATYIRCHDDIGWAITDEDAEAVPGLNAFHHRQFLADFYSGQFAGSFARGGIFQENPITKDRRNSGSFASLAGLEAATTEAETNAALDRILLGVALMASFGGLPLLYMGDEIGLLNDYGFVDIPAHANDNRWLHRPRMQWQNLSPVQQRIFEATRAIIARRKLLPQLSAANPTHIVDSGNAALFTFIREGDEGPLLGIFNFTDVWQNLPEGFIRAQGVQGFHDALSDGDVAVINGAIAVPPYGRLWLV
ncbi:MAG: alpha-amylase family protein [Alphaproteobacteria bacterium]|nr:alpha-amylase family protein [Alphaproteobacteria bacterium]